MMASRGRPLWCLTALVWGIQCIHCFQLNYNGVRIRNGDVLRLYYQEEGPRASPSTTTAISATATATAAPPLPKPTPQSAKRPNDKRWNPMIEKLRLFHQIHGHSMVKESSGDPQLFTWTKSIRRNYRHQALETDNENDSSSSSSSKSTSILPRLTNDRMKVLNDLGFPWDVQLALWKARYAELQRYHKESGHTRVPPNCQDYPGLGVWVRNQRREYKRLEEGGEKKSTLTNVRLQALQYLEFEWYRSHKDSWEARYQELRGYFDEHEHSNVPEDYKDNFSLGQWCMNQRTGYKRYADGRPTALTVERIQLLEDIDFKWNYREHRWYSMQERVKQYHLLHGHVFISTKDDANRDLRGWLILQRYHYNRRKQGKPSALTNQRIEAMEEGIPNFPWKGRNGSGVSSEDWGKLFDAMRDKGIQPGMRPKQHWFEGTNPLEIDVKNMYTEQDLLELWNQEDEAEDDDE